MADVAIRIDKEAALALVEIGGEVTTPDILEAVRTLHDHPDWDIHYDVIWDARTVSSLVIGEDELPRMVEAKIDQSVGREVTVAVRELDQMMASLCALLLRARGRDATVTTTLDEALASLGFDRLPSALEAVSGDQAERASVE